jgi:hypothetical protein
MYSKVLPEQRNPEGDAIGLLCGRRAFSATYSVPPEMHRYSATFFGNPVVDNSAAHKYRVARKLPLVSPIEFANHAEEMQE